MNKQTKHKSEHNTLIFNLESQNFCMVVHLDNRHKYKHIKSIKSIRLTNKENEHINKLLFKLLDFSLAVWTYFRYK